MDLNEVRLLGRLGRDPELKTVGVQGLKVCNFSVATSFRTKDLKEQTEWHSVTCFGKTAETSANFLKKGSSVFIAGRLQTDTWEKDGVKHAKTKIVADKVIFTDSKNSGLGVEEPVDPEIIPF